MDLEGIEDTLIIRDSSSGKDLLGNPGGANKRENAAWAIKNFMLQASGVKSFFVITLDGSHGIKRVIEITKGIVNRCLIHPREVFREAIKDGAVAIIVAHNHPSGNTKPSSEDKEITIKLIKAGEILGIPVLDHVIFTRYNFLGLAGRGGIDFTGGNE